MCGEELDTKGLSKYEAPGRHDATTPPRSGGSEVLRELNDRLHELSQPMTVLLCTTEYGATLDSLDEMKEMTRISRESCERLRRTVVAMQAVVRKAIEKEGGQER